MGKKGNSSHGMESLISHTIKKNQKKASNHRHQDEIKSTKEQELFSKLSSLNETSQLEEFGSFLSINDFSHVLKLFHEEQIPQDKLIPILVGLKSTIFVETIHHIDDRDLIPLKQEGLLEPLQHHIKEFITHSKLLLNEFNKTVDYLDQEIEQFTNEQLTKQIIHLIYSKIEHLHGEYLDLIHSIDKILAIAWKNDREDLIEQLNNVKHTCLWQLHHTIGTKENGERASTSLYARLEEKLLNIYDKNDERNSEINSLNDTDLSIEGLTKLSIWYLKDYWEIGILPSIKNVRELELDLVHHQEKKRLEHRKMLFDLVQKNLSEIGLGTVGDLKKEGIFSKKILKDYINKHKDKLENSILR